MTLNKIILFYFVIGEQLAATRTCSPTVVGLVFYKALVSLHDFNTEQTLRLTVCCACLLISATGAIHYSLLNLSRFILDEHYASI